MVLAGIVEYIRLLCRAGLCTFRPTRLSTLIRNPESTLEWLDKVLTILQGLEQCDGTMPKAKDDKPIRRLLYEDMQSGDKHEFLFYQSPRCDQYRVTVNGKPFSAKIGFTHVLVALRKAAGRFSSLPV